MRIRIRTCMQAAIYGFFDLSSASLDTELFPNTPGSAFANTPPSYPLIPFGSVFASSQ